MDRGHHVENQSQVAAITSNIARGRDVLAALAAAWSSSLDLSAASDETPHLHPTSDTRTDADPSARASQ
jgi:hypothetical protein